MHALPTPVPAFLVLYLYSLTRALSHFNVKFVCYPRLYFFKHQLSSHLTVSRLRVLYVESCFSFSLYWICSERYSYSCVVLKPILIDAYMYCINVHCIYSALISTYPISFYVVYALVQVHQQRERFTSLLTVLFEFLSIFSIC